MNRNRIVAIILIILGLAFLIAIAAYFLDKITTDQPTGMGQDLLGGIMTITSLASVVIGLITLIKDNKGRNIKVGTHDEKPVIDHSGNVVIGNQYQNIYAGITPRQMEEEELQAALARLAELPEQEIPQPAPLPKGSRIPNMRPNPLFVGREQDLKDLARWLKGESPVAIGQVTAATGMGGIGKTQLASEFAHRYGQYFAGGVFWLSFAQPELIPSEVAACCDLEDTSPLEARVKRALSEWQSRMPRLLIFDNC